MKNERKLTSFSLEKLMKNFIVSQDIYRSYTKVGLTGSRETER